MKYLLCDTDKVILYISETLWYSESGDVVVDDGELAYASYLVDQVFEVQNVPDGIKLYQWCYIDNEFVPNPNWIDPEQPTDIDYDLVFGILKGEVE